MPSLLSSRRRVVGALLGGLVAARASRAAEAQRQTWSFDVEEVELKVRGLDEVHDGIRIAQLTDIHIGNNTPDGRVLAAVEAINAAQPDLVVLTGDYVTRKGDPLERVPDLLRGLRGDVTAVLGNHDHWTDARTIRKDLEHCGFAVLQNASTTLSVRGKPFTIFGVDDDVSHHADVAVTWKGAPQTGSRLVLAHSPPTVDQLPSDGGLVCLSGHTHGGQVYLGAVTEGLFSRVGQPYVRGLYQVNGNSLYVSRGLGFGRGSPLMRVGSEPEVTVITLRAA